MNRLDCDIWSSVAIRRLSLENVKSKRTVSLILCPPTSTHTLKSCLVFANLLFLQTASVTYKCTWPVIETEVKFL